MGKNYINMAMTTTQNDKQSDGKITSTHIDAGIQKV